MSIDDYSVLPDNKSPLERGIELAFYQFLAGIDKAQFKVTDPHAAPAHSLPYLAQDRGVTEWSPDDAVAEKRITVANQWPMRRIGGTRKAIKLALDGLGTDGQVIPNWKQVPRGPAYTQEVRAYYRGVSITDELIDRMIRRVEEAKAERSDYALKMGHASVAQVSMVNVAQVFDRMVSSGRDRQVSRAGVGYALVARNILYFKEGAVGL